MKHYLIYQIRNKLNGMIYIGQHQTENVDDGYMGSGLRIQYAINKYGIENFEKTILFECNSEEEMNQKEAEIVNEDFIARDDVYNIVPGGWSGSFKSLSFEDKSKASKKRWQNLSVEKKKEIMRKVHANQIGKHLSDEVKQKISKKLKEVFTKDISKNGMFGKHHSLDSKLKISKHHTGKGNPQFGTMWICNDETFETKKIPNTSEIPNGWRRGRIFDRQIKPLHP